MKQAWVYILANRYRGAMYVGVTSNIAARVVAHREGRGSQHARERGTLRLVWADRAGSMEDAIEHEKRLKRWRREWKFALIEEGNPDWDDFYERLNG
jgi:putative endonuclease